MPKSSLRSWQFWTIITVWTGFIALGLGSWPIFGRGQRFDIALWNDSALVQNGIRLKMADDLIGQGTLRFKTRAEVIALLGEPPPTDYFSDWDLVYWLGPERGYMRIDSEWLVVDFDTEDRVSEYRIVHD